MQQRPPVPTPVSSEIGFLVEAQMTRLLYRSAGFGLFSNFVLAVIMALGLSETISWQAKGAWFAAITGLSLLRLVLNLSYDRSKPPADQHLRWRSGFIVGVVLAGLLWGLAGWAFFKTDDLASSLLLTMILAGMNAGAARSLASVPSSYRLYVLTTLLPISALFLTMPAGGWFLFGITITYALFLLRTANMHHGDLVRLHTLIYQNETYVSELQEAKSKAEESSRIKGDFLATISHEIRTPMNGVVGMLQVLRDSDLTPEQQSQVNIATGSADTLLRLLNDILDFSKIESGKLEFESISFEPAEAVREVVALMRPKAMSKLLSFNLILPPGKPIYVMADPVRLKQVLLNLTGNAIKFTEHGQVDLAMSVTALTDKTATLHFKIHDTGIGIDSGTQAKLFQVFSQGDSSTTRRFGGSGLGLAISQRLVNLMGSSITLTSTPGQGTTFAFDITWPVAKPTIPAGTISTPTSKKTLHGRVLVAEDDPVNQRVIELMLQRLGLEFEIAKTGQEAVQKALNEQWDAILMDCQMPEMDGYAATREIRRTARTHVPIIALTANAMASDRATCIAAGMDDFLSKPLRTEDLHACLQRWLKQPEVKAP